MKNVYGSALVITMIFIFISVSAVGGYLSIITKNSNMVKKMNDSTKALYLAEAGIERTISDLYNGTVPWSARAVCSNSRLGEGHFTVGIEQTQINNMLRLRSTGVVGEDNRIITAYVSRPTAFDWGVFSDNRITFSNRVRIDSYNSRLRDYDRNNAGRNGNVGTNAGDGLRGEIAVRIGNRSSVNGDVVIGPSGVIEHDIRVGYRAEFNGNPSVARALTELPPEDFQGNLGNLPERVSINLQKPERDLPVTITESGQYDFIRIKNHSTLTIDGNVTLYVRDRISMSRGQLNITPGSKVAIYVGRKLKFKHHSTVNGVTRDPTALTIYGTSTMTNIQFNGRSVVYGALYIPNAVLHMRNRATLYGSLVVDSLRMNNRPSIHYDEALRGTGPYLGGPLNVESWQEKY